MPESSSIPPVAYLVNQYPSVSHSFIRREIQALERRGIPILRFSLRGWDAPLADDGDVTERKKTRYTLKEGWPPLLGSVLKTIVVRPRRFFTALRTAFAMSTDAPRPWPVHLVYLAQACRLAGWLEAAGARHLHAHFSTNPAEIACLVSILTGIPYSFTSHGPADADQGERLHLDKKVAHAKFVATISSNTKSLVLRRLPLEHWDRVHIVHCGLTGRSFGDPPAPDRAAPVFLCIGRLVPQKAQLLLVNAFAELQKTHPDARLVLAGDGDMRARLQARITELNLDDAVRITGWISADEVRAELQAATALVQPSFMEGLPVVIMEAMALQRVVISTYIAGIPELVRPGETGWLVPAGATGELTEAMASCLACDTETLARMGRAAQDRVRMRHSIDTEAEKLARLINAD